MRHLQLDALKIDRSLITNIDQNRADLAIVRSILHLAASLDLTIIAEGVESATCLELLARENCRYAQGYYFSYPLPIEETIAIIQEKFETTELANALSSI